MPWLSCPFRPSFHRTKETLARWPVTACGDKPDLLWNNPELDRLYAPLETKFELDHRARAIERRLDVIGYAADVLLNLVVDKRSYRLEIAVAFLIAIEIVMSFIGPSH